uniref:NR LBD domain-containing protein n=1 Tax=Caenorhabditis tropicalis TaxID=1561998 RepID=A0A1I7V232_9PELO
MDSLPETIEQLSGKSSFVIYMDPDSSRSQISYIDLQYLIDKGLQIMNHGSETPILQRNRLRKLLLGRRREKQGEVQIVRRIGKKEAIEFWERDFFAVAKWLTYFEDFQQLPERMKILLLKSIWHVWTRLEKLAITAASRRENDCKDGEIMLETNEAYDTKSVEMDISWFTKFPKEKLKFLFDEPHEWMDLSVIQLLVDLQPTDIELTYMLCQLCFEYAGKRHQGEVQDVTERFQEVLANDLHDYYTNMDMPRYSFRLSQMMKINKMIQEDIRRKRVNLELAKIFPVYCVKFSHPEMFEDLA